MNIIRFMICYIMGSNRFIYIFTLIVGFFTVLSYFFNDFSYYLQSIFYPYFGGSGGQKIFFFFLFLTIPLIFKSLSIKIRKKLEYKHYIRINIFYLVPNAALYAIGIFLFKKELEYRNLPNTAGLLLNINSLTTNSNTWLHHHILKPSLSYLLNILQLNNILNIGYDRWSNFISHDIYYATALLLLIGLLTWILLGYQTIEKYGLLHFFLLSVPAYGIFVTSIDGGFFTSFSHASLGAYSSLTIYFIAKVENIRTRLIVPLIYIFSIFPFLLIQYFNVLLGISALDLTNTPQSQILFPSILSILLIRNELQNSNEKLRFQLIAGLLIFITLTFSLSFLIVQRGTFHYYIMEKKDWEATIYSPSLNEFNTEEIENRLTSEKLKFHLQYKEGGFMHGIFSSNERFKFQKIKSIPLVKKAKSSHGGLYGTSPGSLGNVERIIIFKEFINSIEKSKLNNHPCIKDYNISEDKIIIDVRICHEMAIQSVAMTFRGKPTLGAILDAYDY